MIVIGLTGSIGMGKSTVGGMMETLGIPVHDADAEVHELLQPESKAMSAIAAAFPYFSYENIYGKKTQKKIRTIDRKKLGDLVFDNDEEREKLESILHPYVREAQNEFIRIQKNLGKGIVALDIPLLFETGAEDFVHVTINVSAPDFVQAERVLSRPGMDEDKFLAILKRQIPDEKKCALADYILHTGLGRAHTMKELKTIIHTIKETSSSLCQAP